MNRVTFEPDALDVFIPQAEAAGRSETCLAEALRSAAVFPQRLAEEAMAAAPP